MRTSRAYPATAAPVRISFRDVAGSICGSLLPTGNTSDTADGVRITCIDNGMPVVVIAAASVGCTGCESVAELNADAELRTRLEAICRTADRLMGTGDVASKVVPKAA